MILIMFVYIIYGISHVSMRRIFRCNILKRHASNGFFYQYLTLPYKLPDYLLITGLTYVHVLTHKVHFVDNDLKYV